MKMGKWAMHAGREEMKVMEELSKGRELAMKLRRLLLNIDDDDDDDHVPIIGAGAGGEDDDDDDDDDDDLVLEHLAGKIQDSFWNSLSILKNYYSDHHQVSHRIINSQYSGISDHDQRTTTTTTVPKLAGAAAAGRREGGYKRRKCSDLDIRKTEHSTIEYDDGHAWRKYGQKIIHNTKFPRSYYRCTHKYDQGCGATKQMEMIQQNPGKYVSRYYGHHTCTTPQKHVQFLLESLVHYTNYYSNSKNNTTTSNNVKMLSFGSDDPSCSCSPSTTTTTTTFQLPAHSCTPMVNTSTLQAEEDNHDHLINKYRTSSSVKDDEQFAGAAVLTQLHPPAAAADNWCRLSPEYLLPIGSSDDDDDASNDSLDFTDLQHYFTFS